MFLKNPIGFALLFLFACPSSLDAQESLSLNSVSPLLNYSLQVVDAAYMSVQDANEDDGAPEYENDDSKEARQELLEAYREVFGPDDALLKAYLEGGKGTLIIDDFWVTTDDYDRIFGQSRIEIDLSVLTQDRGMAWGVLTLRKQLLASLNWDRQTRNHYIGLLLANDPERAERIINSIRWEAIQALMVEIETLVDQIGEGAEIIISFTDAGDIAVTIKDVANPDTPVITKVFTAGAGMLPIVPGKFGKWVGDKINDGVTFVWRKATGWWKRSSKLPPSGRRISVFHKGELENGSVGRNRTLSTGKNRETVLALDRPGKVHEFQIPEEELIQWELEGLVWRFRDEDLATGVINEELRFSPSLAEFLNKYKLD